MEPNEMEKTSSSKVILSIIIILVVAAIGYAMLRTDGEGDMATTTGATTTDETAISGTVFDLVRRGGDWRCTWESEQDGIELHGTVFVSRGKFKSDVEMEGAGLNATAHAIGDGEYVYSWSSVAPTGIKFPVAEGATGVEVAGSSAQEAQFTEQYSYDCEEWRADSGTFALPTGITFTEAATQ